MSKDEIDRMVSEAEKYKAEDDANKNRIEAKNGLENYCYSLKSSISSPEVEGKIPAFIYCGGAMDVRGAVEFCPAILTSQPTPPRLPRCPRVCGTRSPHALR